jgi:Ca2+-binding RTX toxin-like protein
MFNADRVRVVGDGGDQTLVLDLGGGRFGPGATHEETKISEVEVSFEAGHGTDEFDVWGTDHADEINASVGVIELNHDGDAGDAFGWGIDRVEIDGLGGSDDLRANSYRGLVVADGGSGKDLVKGWHFADHLRGGSGADRIVGLDGNDRIDAGSGVDTVLAGDGNDRLRVGDSTIEHQIACGPGTDTVQTWDVGDDGVATACENWAT